MTRAEEKALEIFPVKKVPFYGLACNACSERDANLDKRALFCMGYEQAEKDLVLTISDLELLHTFLYAVKNNKQGCFTFTRLSDEQYEEVLRRFNEAKK